jgi:valyl-tRNA synthetase
MDKFGTDAFRFTLTAFAAQGRDVKLSEERIAGYRNFVNKIWNAARFTLMNLEGGLKGGEELPATLEDRWIISRAHRTAAEVALAIEEYRFDAAAGGLYQFAWHEFCDWYVELIKPVLYGDDEEAKARTQSVLAHVLSVILRLLHPIIPFVTEEIWHKLPMVDGSVMVAPFPTAEDGRPDPDAEKKMAVIQGVITAVRNIRGEMNVPPSQKIQTIMMSDNAFSREVIQGHQEFILSLIRGDSVEVTEPKEKPKGVAAQVAGDVEVLVKLAGLIDFDEEARRLEKEIAKVEKEMAVGQKKLSNQGFLNKAPADVVAKQKEKVADLQVRLDKLSQNLERVSSLRG